MCCSTVLLFVVPHSNSTHERNIFVYLRIAFVIWTNGCNCECAHDECRPAPSKEYPICECIVKLYFNSVGRNIKIQSTAMWTQSAPAAGHSAIKNWIQWVRRLSMSLWFDRERIRGNAGSEEAKMAGSGVWLCVCVCTQWILQFRFLSREFFVNKNLAEKLTATIRSSTLYFYYGHAVDSSSAKS